MTAPAQLYTADEAAAALDVPAARIRAWKRQGAIAPSGLLRGPGRGGLIPLYRLDELHELADRYHKRHPARHTGPDQD